MSQRTLEVRGYTSFNRPASQRAKILSKVIDFALILTLILFGIDFFEITPFPGFTVLSLVSAVALLYWIPQKVFWGITLGERLWRLHAKGDFPYRLNEALTQQDHLKPVHHFFNGLWTTAALVLVMIGFKQTLFKHPLWLNASLWKLPSFTPPSDDWIITPFFYSIGAWPKTFNEKPIFYTLIYEKGPPRRFLGHIIANWDSPDIRVILEGPKTPEQKGTQRRIKECVLNPSSYSCLVLRDHSLIRHIHEGRAIHPSQWTLNWFTVENPSIPPENQAQGIYLSAASETMIEDRFILVHPNGTHQALILVRPKNQEGILAFETLQKIIGSIRNLDQLDSGRNWINQTLEHVQLDELSSIQDPQLLAQKLAEIQSLLISRISVDPAGFDSYFHLAGTSLMLAKNSLTHPERNPLASIQIRFARENLEATYRFASDIDPRDPRTTQIQSLWLETNKK